MLNYVLTISEPEKPAQILPSGFSINKTESRQNVRSLYKDINCDVTL